MMNELCFVTECFVETRVTQILLQTNGHLNHQHGKGKVINTLEGALKNQKAVGIVDHDKIRGNQQSELYKYHLKEDDSVNFLKLLKHRQREHFIIVVCPAWEKWLMNCCSNAAINPVEFNLPADLEGLCDITKSKDIHKNEEFKNLIKTLIRKNVPPIIKLRDWLIEMKEK
ncbi:MAG: hypothetical protein ABI723_20725 [Bacteroidia bacterium]